MKITLRQTLVEGIGTCLLTFSILGSLSQPVPDMVQVYLVHGIAIYVLSDIFQGGHFNPAVSLAELIQKRIDVLQFTMYRKKSMKSSIQNVREECREVERHSLCISLLNSLAGSLDSLRNTKILNGTKSFGMWKTYPDSKNQLNPHL